MEIFGFSFVFIVDDRCLVPSTLGLIVIHTRLYTLVTLFTLFTLLYNVVLLVVIKQLLSINDFHVLNVATTMLFTFGSLYVRV